eukprot:42666-Chlamydomonas_euryale.AAC.1
MHLVVKPRKGFSGAIMLLTDIQAQAGWSECNRALRASSPRASLRTKERSGAASFRARAPRALYARNEVPGTKWRDGS